MFYKYSVEDAIYLKERMKGFRPDLKDAGEYIDKYQIIAAMEALVRENERLRKALEFYANKENTWEDGEYEGGCWFSVAERDKGETARKALKEEI